MAADPRMGSTSGPSVPEGPQAGLLAVYGAVGLTVALVVAFTPGLLVVFLVGMIPTMVAALVDRAPGRTTTHCVAATNLAGVVPVLVKVWMEGGTMQDSMQALHTPHTWLPMLGGAAVGWGLLKVAPILAARVARFLAERERRRLEAYQSDLVQTWGRKVLDDN